MEMEMVRVVEIEGRGRGLVASQPLRGGQIILKESPILLYSAFPLTLSLTNSNYCANCFKTLPSSSSSQSQSCQSCCLEVFCSPQCYSHSQSHSHTQWACQTLLRLRQALSAEAVAVERHQQARFLVAAYNLALHSPALFHTLLSLHGSPDSDSDSDSAAAQFLHPLLSLPPDLSVETSAALLAKDKLNAFGLMEPFYGETSGGGRSVRAYGIYPKASLFNHDCLPNACRFDYVDSDSNSNTDISVRMIHDVPAGREICVSYFPVNLNYRSRQRRVREDYGFACDCDRCKVEANWSDKEEEDENANVEQEGGEEDNVVVDMEDEEEEENVTMEEEDEDCSFPHAYFFARYMCNRNNCWGTLAPLPPPHSPSSYCGDDDVVVMECNVCGNLQTHHD